MMMTMTMMMMMMIEQNINLPQLTYVGYYICVEIFTMNI